MSMSERSSGPGVVIASADAVLRSRLRERLGEMRWTVQEASGGAEAAACLDASCPEALVVDSWLPDLEVNEFLQQIALLYPGVDLVWTDGTPVREDLQYPRRGELLHALRSVAFNPAQGAIESVSVTHRTAEASGSLHNAAVAAAVIEIPEMIGSSMPMLELARLIRLVAPRSTSVLIEGETGSGKEVVAHALHRLSARAHRPFVVLNCAAIPEALLESELFGHTRGAFTGAVQSRIGRIEAADGGTLFLDEIGEMPLALQAKMLRFLECGELQRVGENNPVHVDVRVIAATHQPLEQRSAEGTFRLDLYHRLAVFPLDVPALRERREDIPTLARHLLAERGRELPRKRLSAGALERLLAHDWPGNVRELGHVLERAAILAGDNPEIGANEIRVRRTPREPFVPSAALPMHGVQALR